MTYNGNDISISLQNPQPPQGGGRSQHLNIMWYINCRVLNGGDFKKDIIISLQTPSGGGGEDPHIKYYVIYQFQGFQWWGFQKWHQYFSTNPLTLSGRGEGKEPTLKILYDISILGFSMVGISKMTNDPQWKYWCQFWNAHYWKPYNWYILSVDSFPPPPTKLGGL